MSPDSLPFAIEGGHHGSMLEVPIAAEFREPMIAFWEAMFGVSFADIRPIMSGDERAVQRDIFWSIWSEDRPQATCHLTIDRHRPTKVTAICLILNKVMQRRLDESDCSWYHVEHDKSTFTQPADPEPCACRFGPIGHSAGTRTYSLSAKTAADDDGRGSRTRLG